MHTSGIAMKSPASRRRGRPRAAPAATGAAAPAKRRPAARRWLIPPPLLSDPGGEHVPDIAIVAEHPRTSALLFWNAVRDLMQWATCPQELRTELFPTETARVRTHQLETAELPPDVATWLELLMGVLYGLADVPRPGMLTDVCERLAGWAAAKGKVETAVGFAQGAALAEPMDARAACLAGEFAASFGKSARAESWFQRAVGIARRRNDWRIYASSYHGLAEVALRRGAWRYAEERFRFGLRAARRNGFRSEQADGYIGLLRVAVATGRFEEARRWESRARRLVGRGPERLQKLAAASVDLWMHTGDYARALEGLEILRLDTTSREQRMYVLARIAHASAGIGDIHRLSDAWTQAWDLAESAVSAPRQLRYHTFIELHRAAALTRDQVRAVRALNFAAGLARVSSESHEVDELRRGAGRTQPASAPPGDAPDASGEVSSREAGDPAVEAIHE